MKISQPATPSSSNCITSLSGLLQATPELASTSMSSQSHAKLCLNCATFLSGRSRLITIRVIIATVQRYQVRPNPNYAGDSGGRSSCLIIGTTPGSFLPSLSFTIVNSDTCESQYKPFSAGTVSLGGSNFLVGVTSDACELRYKPFSAGTVSLGSSNFLAGLTLLEELLPPHLETLHS